MVLEKPHYDHGLTAQKLIYKKILALCFQNIMRFHYDILSVIYPHLLYCIRKHIELGFPAETRQNCIHLGFPTCALFSDFHNAKYETNLL